MSHQNGDSPEKMVNGDKRTTSAFVEVSHVSRIAEHGTDNDQHLLHYPIVHDTLATLETHPLTARPMALTASTYSSLSATLTPFLAGPYRYLQPYVARADELGDSTLNTLDARVPAVHKPTQELLEDGKTLLGRPLVTGRAGVEYVGGLYQGEIQRIYNGQGSSRYGLAIVTTSMLVARDARAWLARQGEAGRQRAAEAKNEHVGSS